MKMNYDERETEYVKFMKNRTAIGKLHDQCVSYGLDYSGPGWMNWADAADEFAKMSWDYDHGVEFKQESLTRLYNMKLPNNIIVVKRIIKLTRIGIE